MKSQIFLAMIASSVLLATFVAVSKGPASIEAVDMRWAFLVGFMWALVPWATGIVVAGLNASIAMARRRHVKLMRDFIWSTGLMLIMLVVVTIANP
ncbi:MAG: hypothetical protein O7C63_07485 [Alphaproteobacteria bacterium]|nr:hypothetical protein [Alphaproteobacteria bacterium]